MAIVDSLITYFGIDLLNESSTFIDLLNTTTKIGLSMWLTIFIIRSMFLATTIAGRRFY